MNSQITLLAFAGKWLFFGARGFSRGSAAVPVSAARSLSLASRAASANSPAPPPAWARSSRRESCTRCMRGPPLLDIHKLVQTKQHLAEVGQRELAGVGLCRGGVGFFLSGKERSGCDELFLVGRAADGGEVALPHTVGWRLLVGGQQLFGKVVGIGANVRAVQESQSLRGNRGAGPAADADQRLGLVEELHHRHELASLDHEINASPRVPLVERPGAVERAVESATHCEHAVANRLRLQP